MRKVYLALLQLACPLVLTAQAGSFDPSFNGVGYNITAIGNNDDLAQTLWLQPDGKILVAGESHSGASIDAAVVRYNADGTLDASFGTGGKVTYVASLNYYETLKAVFTGSDGKITAVGYYFSPSFTFEIFLLRLNSDGSLDATFGTNGFLTVSISTGSDQANAALIQPDDKIVITGNYDNNGNIDAFVLRLNYDGTVDATFGGGDGVVSLAAGSGSDYSNAIALQADGKIVIAGKTFSSSNSDFLVARLLSDGTPDNTFSSDGIATMNINGNDSGFAVAVQSDGAIVVCGEAFDGSSFNVGVARFTAAGAADNTFSGDGKLSTAVGGSYDGGYAVGIHENGKIIVGGLYAASTSDDMMLIRYLSNGSLDASFGSNGIAKFNLGFNEAIYALHIKATGRVLVAGKATNGSNADFMVAQVLSEYGVSAIDFQNHANVRIFPNPASHCAVLQQDMPVAESGVFRLFSPSGQLLLTWSADAPGQELIPFCLPASVPAGHYHLQYFNHRRAIWLPLQIVR